MSTKTEEAQNAQPTEVESTAWLAIGKLDRPLKIGDRVKTLSGEIYHLVNEHGDDIATENFFYRWCKYSYTIEHAAMADDDEITHILDS